MYHRLLGFLDSHRQIRLPRSGMVAFLPTPSSDKQKFPHLGWDRQGLGESESSVVPRLFLKVVPGVRTSLVRGPPEATSCCLQGQKSRVSSEGSQDFKKPS